MSEPRTFSIRVPEGIMKLIEQDVKINQEYLTRTEWIMDAIRIHLNHRIEQGAIKREVNGGGVSTTLNRLESVRKKILVMRAALQWMESSSPLF